MCTTNKSAHIFKKKSGNLSYAPRNLYVLQLVNLTSPLEMESVTLV